MIYILTTNSQQRCILLPLLTSTRCVGQKAQRSVRSSAVAATATERQRKRAAVRERGRESRWRSLAAAKEVEHVCKQQRASLVCVCLCAGVCVYCHGNLNVGEPFVKFCFCLWPLFLPSLLLLLRWPRPIKRTKSSTSCCFVLTREGEENGRAQEWEWECKELAVNCNYVQSAVLPS